MQKIIITVCALAMLTACSGNKDGSNVSTTASSALVSELTQTVGDKVYFSYDRSNISQESKVVLQKQADLMKRYGSDSFTIEGHCDMRGTSEYNIALGERRANATKQFLVKEGVASDRLTVISYGKEKLADTGVTAESHAKNRRSVTVAN